MSDAPVHILKPDADAREYEYVLLPNRLRCVLISDPEADKAAACMDVHAGSVCDPVELPGLAHFLEHMLFLGTRKYPKEGEYHEYLSEHGGAHNAYTAQEDTVYYFDCVADALRDALDRFAQFFVAPLFSEGATSRELSAVDSEHSNNLQSDQWRLFQLGKSLARAGHPSGKFGTGSLATLRDAPVAAGVDVRGALVAFYEAHYSANRMTLCIYGREPLATLRGWARELFADVVDRALAEPAAQAAAAAAPPYASRAEGGLLGTLQQCVPVLDVRLLTVCWQLPPTRPHWRSKPCAYVSHLLGHESEGSLLHHLKAKGLAEALSAGESVGTEGWCVFALSLELTEQGDAAVDAVLDAVFEYVAVVRATGAADAGAAAAAGDGAAVAGAEGGGGGDDAGVAHAGVAHAGVAHAVVDELRDLAALAFRFEEAGAALSRAQHVATALRHYPPADVLAGPALQPARDDGALRALLTGLAPGAAFAQHVSKRFEADAADALADGDERPAGGAGALGCWRRERWYGSRFRLVALADAQLARWADVPAQAAAAAARAPPLALPALNPFVPTDFALRAPAATGPPPHPPPPPTRLANAPRGVALWHKLDATFRKPRTAVYVQIKAAGAYASAEASVLANLWSKLLADALQPYAYHAECADLHYSLYNSTRGLVLKLGGYSDRLPELLRRIAQRAAGLRGGAVLAERFELLREQQRLDYANFWKAQPYGLADYAASTALETPKWHVHEYQAFLADEARCTPDALRAFAADRLFADGVDLDVLVHGNATEADARRLADIVATELLAPGPAGGVLLPPSRQPASRCVRLPRGPGGVRLAAASANADEPNAAVDLTLQVGRSSARRDALLAFAVATLEPRLFAQLRTNEQLGYIVATATRWTHGVRALRIVVQSKTASAEQLEARIEAFLASFATTLGALTPTEFENYRTSLIEARLQRDKTMSEETSRDWAEIAGGTLTFDRNALEVDALRALEPRDVVAFWRQCIEPGAPHRRKLLVAVRQGAAVEPPPPPPPLADDAPKAVPVAPAAYELLTDEDVLGFKREMALYPCARAPQSALSAAGDDDDDDDDDEEATVASAPASAPAIVQ